MSLPSKKTQQQGLRFSVSHLLLLSTAASFLFYSKLLLGTFLASLILGILMIGVSIALLKIENLLLGGLTGVFLSLVVLLLATLLSMFQQEPQLGGKLLAAILLYPLYGYLVGIFSTVDRTMDSV